MEQRCNGTGQVQALPLGRNSGKMRLVACPGCSECPVKPSPAGGSSQQGAAPSSRIVESCGGSGQHADPEDAQCCRDCNPGVFSPVLCTSKQFAGLEVIPMPDPRPGWTFPGDTHVHLEPLQEGQQGLPGQTHAWTGCDWPLEGLDSSHTVSESRGSNTVSDLGTLQATPMTNPSNAAANIHPCVSCGDLIAVPARQPFDLANIFTFAGTTYAGHPVVTNQGGSVCTRYAAHLAPDGKVIRLTKMPERFQPVKGHAGADEHEGELVPERRRWPVLLDKAEREYLAALIDVDEGGENAPPGVDAGALKDRLEAQ